MRVVAIDMKGRNGAWKKRWSTLDISGLFVLTPEEVGRLLGDCNEATLLLVHEAAYPDEVRKAKLEGAVAALSPLCFLLFVSHSGSPSPETRCYGQIHVSGVPFPNQRSSLSDLTGRLERLMPRLEASLATDGVAPELASAARMHAWERWEDEAEHYFEAIWGLCQAYLVANLDEVEREVSSGAAADLRHAREWLKRYRSAIAQISATDDPLSVQRDVSRTMAAAPEFWRLSGSLEHRELRGEWPTGKRGVEKVEQLILESAKGNVSLATVLDAFEALDGLMGDMR